MENIRFTEKVVCIGTNMDIHFRAKDLDCPICLPWAFQVPKVQNGQKHLQTARHGDMRMTMDL